MPTLAAKIQQLQPLFAAFFCPPPQIFPSPLDGYRQRVEFGLYHEGEALHYSMRDGAGQIVKIDRLPRAAPAIQALMPPLREALRAQPSLRHRLFQINFLSTLQGEMLLTLLYHRPLDADWTAAAEALGRQFNVEIIGRSRGQKIVLGRSYVNESFTVGGERFHYRHYEGAFSQPNGRMCEQMLQWAWEQTQTSQREDLLELYCGSGNFTLPLSRNFRRVLATEVSKTAIQALRENQALNHIDNLQVARLAAEELTVALRGDRPFRRLQQDAIDLGSYDFGTVLVDPPRAGVDAGTLALLQQFPRILYISCNPLSLAANLQRLSQSHQPKRFAVFDQFPDTPHLELGLLLERR